MITLLISFLMSLAAYNAEAQLEAFLPPIPDLYAANADIAPVITVSNSIECAQHCLNTFNCISFNLCGSNCGISGFSMAYVPTNSPSCSLYTRLRPRNDTRIIQAIPWGATSPAPHTVSLSPSGLLGETFIAHRDTYLAVRSPLDMLFFFYERAGQVPPKGAKCFGWDEWIKGSATGNFMMGAGSYLQWATDAMVQSNLQQVVDGIIALQDPKDGWVFAFNESDIDADNLPDYCASWVTRGLIDADRGGIIGALDIARQQISIFNNHSKLAWFLPTNGGPNPVQPFPQGFNNVTMGGLGQDRGHMIYIQYQGMIKHTLMALTRQGTQADVDIVTQLYTEQYWLEALLAKDPYHAIWHRTFFAHNYEITAFEAFLDIYVLTGNKTFYTAVLNAWEMLRAHWILPGGSFALNEDNYYPPDSYYIGFTGMNIGSGAHSHNHHHPTEDDPYYHAPCMPNPNSNIKDKKVPLKAEAMKPEKKMSPLGPNDNDPPTGELCGSVFWTKLNQRFRYLHPENETFVEEIERSILNVGLSALGKPGSGGQGPNGTGIRYFANQHKQKQNPSMHASCCEGQGTRLFGSLPEFVFTVMGNHTLYIDLYSDSVIGRLAGGKGTLFVKTKWPYAPHVNLSVVLPEGEHLDLALRIPSWAGPGPVKVSGGFLGTPGTFLHIAVNSTLDIQLDLPMSWRAQRYLGSSQLPPYTRYSYLYGPLLMSFEGPWDNTTDSLVMPQGLDPTTPEKWLLPKDNGNGLEFYVSSPQGTPSILVKPYYAVQEAGEIFTNYPCFF